MPGNTQYRAPVFDAGQRPFLRSPTGERELPVNSRNEHRHACEVARSAGRGAAVAWLESGVHIKAVADLLGHSSIAITGDVYGHTSDDTARAAVDGLAGRLGL